MFSKSGREIYLDYLDRIEKRNQQRRPGDPAPKFSPYRISTIPKWNPDQQAPEPPQELPRELGW